MIEKVRHLLFSLSERHMLQDSLNEICFIRHVISTKVWTDGGYWCAHVQYMDASDIKEA